MVFSTLVCFHVGLLLQKGKFNYYWAILSVNNWVNQSLVKRIFGETSHSSFKHYRSVVPQSSSDYSRKHNYVVDAVVWCSCCFYQTISVTVEEQWPTTLADYIRHNDETLLKCSERLMATYTEELLPATSFEEMCDVLG